MSTTQDTPLTEDDLWRDAWRIAWLGAANPTAVAGTIGRHLSARTHTVGTREAGRHPAIHAMIGHLGFLTGMPEFTLGPSDESLRAVQENGARLGL